MAGFSLDDVYQFFIKEDHGIQAHHFMANNGETMEAVTDFIFLGSKITAILTAATKLKDTCSWEEKPT